MTRTTLGIALATATAVISGFAVFLNSYAVKEMADPALFTTLKNGMAAFVLVGASLLFVKRPALDRMDRRSWTGVALVGIIGGSIPFLLFFTGLSLASAPSAAFIHKTLFVWVALLAVPLLGERLGWLQIGALAVLVVSQFLIVPPTGVSWGIGETMIAGATLLWAVEVVLARRLLARVDPFVLGVGRLGIGLLVLVGYLAFTGRLPMILGLGAEQWTWVVVTGIVLAGYVATWLGALSRAPATVVTSVLVLGAPITALLDAFSKGTLPAPAPLAGHALILTAAVVLVLVTIRRQARPTSLSPASATST